MKKFLCALVVVLLFAVPVSSFAGGSAKTNVEVITVQLINSEVRSNRSGSSEKKRDQRVKDLASKIEKILKRNPDATVTMVQSSGKFFTQITVIVRY